MTEVREGVEAGTGPPMVPPLRGGTGPAAATLAMMQCMSRSLRTSRAGCRPNGTTVVVGVYSVRSFPSGSSPPGPAVRLLSAMPPPQRPELVKDTRLPREQEPGPSGARA